MSPVLSEIRPVPAAQERQARDARRRSGVAGERAARTHVVPAGRPGQEHDVHIAAVCYLAQRLAEAVLQKTCGAGTAQPPIRRSTP